MNYQERRKRILEMLLESEDYINAAQFAQAFGVTRQIIVSDIAILRANGHRILATRRGYCIEQSSGGALLKSIACRHRSDQVLDEFYTVVDNGGCVVSVVIEHPIYGQISADLNIASRYDADEFVQRQRTANASQLCDLTGGLHLHMIRVPNEAAYERILSGLEHLNILAENADTE